MSSFDLSAKATQTTFAELVGTTQPAIAKFVAKGVLHKGGTYAQWLISYTEKLRKEAAGRGADNADRLTEARIAESHENTLSKRQDRLQKAGVLVAVDDIAQVVEEMGSSIQSSWMGAGNRIIEAIESQHEIELDDDIVNEPLRDSLRALAIRTQEFIGDLQGDERSLSSET